MKPLEERLKTLRGRLWSILPPLLAWTGLITGFVGNYSAGAFLLLASLYFESMELRPIDLMLTREEEAIDPDDAGERVHDAHPETIAQQLDEHLHRLGAEDDEPDVEPPAAG